MIKPAVPYYNIDPVGKQLVSDAIYDGYRDDAEDLCSRFGLVEFCDLGTGKPGDGLFWWDKVNTLIAVSGGRAFRVNDDGSTVELPSDPELVIELNEGTPVIFAPDNLVESQGSPVFPAGPD